MTMRKPTTQAPQKTCGCQKKAKHNQKKRKKRVGKRTDENHMRKLWVMTAIGVVWGMTLATVSTWNSYWLANEGTNHFNDVTWHQERRQMPGHWSPSQTPERQDKSQTNSCASHTSEASDWQRFPKKPIKTQGWHKSPKRQWQHCKLLVAGG